jgi:S-adenosylmethionine hydrolase
LSHSVITLLSDLGTRDASATVSRAILMRHAPASSIIDISHNVAQYDLRQAAYLLLSAYRHFSKGAVHVVPVDVFAGNAPRMLLAEKDGFFFIAPDNGLLPLVFGHDLQNALLCHEFNKQFAFSEWINSAGRVIEQIQSGSDLPFAPCTIKEVPLLLQPKALPDGVECNILYIDRYENVVLDITRIQFDEFMKKRPFRIKIMRMQDVTRISSNYNDVKQGEPLCRFNDAGFLEIALNHAPAASLLGLGTNNAGNLRYRTIKIFLGA